MLLGGDPSIHPHPEPHPLGWHTRPKRALHPRLKELRTTNIVATSSWATYFVSRGLSKVVSSRLTGISGLCARTTTSSSPVDNQSLATSHRKRKARTEATVFTEQLTDLALYFGVFGERLETGINRYSTTKKSSVAQWPPCELPNQISKGMSR